MFIVMIIASLLYFLFIIHYARSVIKEFAYQSDCELNAEEQQYDKTHKQKTKILEKKNELERNALEIFTLYELTSEITKQLNEEDAFAVFKEELQKNVKFKECQLVDIAPGSRNNTQIQKDDFVFSLKSKRSRLGNLVVRGLSEEDKEKVIILGSQFALALRRVKLYHEIEELAITDSLTDIHTRRYFLERFEEELKRSKSRKTELAFLMIDVDHFKNFNDMYGHLVGDQILRAVGSLIKENIREIDIVGRYGGEEFCVVLPDTDYDGAHFAAERIRSAVEEKTIDAYDTEVNITVSVGVSSFPKDGRISAELIDKADWALYRAKKHGRNCICIFGHYE